MIGVVFPEVESDIVDMEDYNELNSDSDEVVNYEDFSSATDSSEEE